MTLETKGSNNSAGSGPITRTSQSSGSDATMGQGSTSNQDLPPPQQSEAGGSQDSISTQSENRKDVGGGGKTNGSVSDTGNSNVPAKPDDNNPSSKATNSKQGQLENTMSIILSLIGG